MDQISRLKDELTSQIEEKLTSQIQQRKRDQLRDELRHELRRESNEKLESMDISQQHTPLQEVVVLPTRGRASTKGSCAAEDEEEDTNTDTSYWCKLFVRDPPRLVAIGRVFVGSLTLYIVQLGDDFCRVVVEEVKQVDVEVSMPTSEIRLVGEAPGTFIVWPTHLLQAISKRPQVFCFVLILFKFTLNVI